MFFSLCIRNVRRSFRDYGIYFLTLSLSVAIFYTFNSIESHKFVVGMNPITKEIFKYVSDIMSTFSIFVAFVLGMLVIYANNFIIKRRKKELGLYKTLGMGKNSISRMLVVETIIIGIISLFIGALIGIVTSQVLSIVTMKIFNLDLDNYKFVFSINSLIKTVCYFSLIFALEMLLNSYSISRFKIIDLIYDSRKAEDVKVKSIARSIAIFILSVIILLISYDMCLNVGFFKSGNFIKSIYMGIIGTFLLFKSLPGFITVLIKSNDKIFLKDINLFIVRQITNKVNKNFVSLSLITFMLFMTIIMLSSGLGINSALTRGIELRYPYDAVIYSFDKKDPVEVLKKNKIDIKSIVSDELSYTIHDSKLPYMSLFEGKFIPKKFRKKINNDNKFGVIKLSDYNKLLELQNKERVSLENDEFIFFSKSKFMISRLNNYLYEAGSLKIGDKSYISKFEEGIFLNIDNDIDPDDMGKFVIDDEFVEKLEKIDTRLVLKLKKDTEKDVTSIINNIVDDETKNKVYNELEIVDRDTHMANDLGWSTMIVYLGIYIGVVFLITSGAILSLQQLTETTDNIERYNILSNIGVGKNMINKSIFIQIAIYFTAPLLLATISSIVGLRISTEIVTEFGNTSMFEHIIIASIFICLIYGAYFLATYFSSKSIVKSKLK